MDTTTSRLKPDELNSGALKESVVPDDDNTVSASATENDVAIDRMENEGIPHKEVATSSEASDWEQGPENPYNWPADKKWHQVAMCASFGFLG